MKKQILLVILFFSRALGLFRLARKLTENELRILCYHATALRDENEFRDGLFITPELFNSRMAFLKSRGYNVISLDEGVRALYEETFLPSCPTVITIDDGWLGTASDMAGILDDFGFPSTLYLSTYYVANQVQVFNVAVDYVLWKATPQPIDLALMASEIAGEFDTGDPDQRKAASHALRTYGNSLQSADARQDLLRRICEQVGVDYHALRDERLITFMDDDEARAIQAKGVDLQLHTHRHRFPKDDEAAARAEITDNRNYLKNLTSGKLVHFCYPSGEYDVGQFPLLEELGIESATTTRSGFNTKKTHRLELNRFLDSANTSTLQFEAEISGFFELIRRVGRDK